LTATHPPPPLPCLYREPKQLPSPHPLLQPRSLHLPKTPSKSTKSTDKHNHEIINLIASKEEEKPREKHKSSPKGKRKVNDDFYYSTDSGSSEESSDSGSSDKSENSDDV
jgi:hypothetical protein